MTHLVIKRPRGFTFCPGDWIFLRIPVIANYEDHPFTISSPPELQDELWLHVRSVGHWTQRLYDYFSERKKGKSVAVQVRERERET